MAVLGLRFCVRVFSSCGKRGPLFIAVRGPLTIAAPLVAGHRLQTRRLSNCGSRVQPLRGMWDLPRPGLEPVSPALAGRLSTTAPPGKPNHRSFWEREFEWPQRPDCIWQSSFLREFCLSVPRWKVGQARLDITDRAPAVQWPHCTEQEYSPWVNCSLTQHFWRYTIKKACTLTCEACVSTS